MGKPFTIGYIGVGAKYEFKTHDFLYDYCGVELMGDDDTIVDYVTLKITEGTVDYVHPQHEFDYDGRLRNFVQEWLNRRNSH